MDSFSDNYSSRPRQNGLSTTPLHPAGQVPGEGEPAAPTSVPAGRYLLQDENLSPVSGQGIQDRQVAYPVLQQLKDKWQQILQDFQYEYDETGYNAGVLSDCLESQVAPFIEKLWHFSVIKEKLNSEQMAEFRQFVSEVSSEIATDIEPMAKPEAAAGIPSLQYRTLGSHGAHQFKERLEQFHKQLRDRQQLNDMLSMPDRISTEVSQVLKVEEQYLNIVPRKNKGGSKPTTPQTYYQHLEQALGQSSVNLKQLNKMPPSADIAWVAASIAPTLKLPAGQLSHCPDSIQHLETECLLALEQLSASETLKQSETLYQATLSPEVDPEQSLYSTLSEENLPSLTALNISRQQSPSESWPQMVTKALSQSLPPKPRFPFNPVVVNNFQHDKAVTLKPVTPEIAEEFQEAIRKPDADKIFYQGFRDTVQGFVTRLVEDEGDAFRMMHSGDTTFTRDTSDTDFEDESSPNLHSQVSVTRPDGNNKALCANHIQYDGQPAGIAMSAATTADFPDLMRMAWENNSHVFLDLLANRDRHKVPDRFDWSSVPESPEALTLGEFTLSREEAVTHKLKTRAAGTDNPAEVIIHKLILTGPGGEQRQLSYIGFPGWPDAKAIDLDQMEELQDLVAAEEALYPDRQGLVVNCRAGVGRTGSFFAIRHLRNKAEAYQLDPDNVPAEILNVILQGKLYRNEMFVQYASQAVMVSEMGQRYAARQQFAPDSPAASAKPETQAAKPSVQIGQFTPEPVTVEMGQAFSIGLKSTLERLSELKKAFEDAPLDMPQNQFNKIYEDYGMASYALPEDYLNLTTEAMAQTLPRAEACAIQHTLEVRNTPRLWGHIQKETGSRYYPSDAPYTRGESPDEIRARGPLACPLTHSQVTVQTPSGQTVRMCANHINIAGKDMGIAMQAPRPNELDLVLQAMVDNHIDTHVDLVSDSDRIKHDEDPVLDWGQLQPQMKTKKFTLVRTDEPVIEIKHEGNTFRVIPRTLTIQPRAGGESRTVRQLSMPDWPDGQPLPHQVLKQFVQQLDGKLMVNCMAGAGRSGTLMVARHIDTEASKQPVSATSSGRLTLEGLLHARLSRSGAMVHVPHQARELLLMEESY